MHSLQEWNRRQRKHGQLYLAISETVFSIVS